MHNILPASEKAVGFPSETIEKHSRMSTARDLTSTRVLKTPTDAPADPESIIQTWRSLADIEPLRQFYQSLLDTFVTQDRKGTERPYALQRYLVRANGSNPLALFKDKADVGRLFHELRIRAEGFNGGFETLIRGVRAAIITNGVSPDLTDSDNLMVDDERKIQLATLTPVDLRKDHLSEKGQNCEPELALLQVIIRCQSALGLASKGSDLRDAEALLGKHEELLKIMSPS